ncbi:MAG TPA: HXXEE domain-containing protein [Anoxybacillus sp.]|nr:HXXEE domain-containing protein [Anoxybacillus sp.]
MYLIHDMEEILTVETFLREHQEKIPFSVTTIEFTVAFLVLYIISVFGCYRVLRNKSFLGMSPAQYFIVLVPGFLFANGVGHVLQFIYFRSYVPGIYTTLVVIFPYCFFSLRFLFKHKILSKTKFLFIFLSAFILQAPLAFIALLLGEILV